MLSYCLFSVAISNAGAIESVTCENGASARPKNAKNESENEKKGTKNNLAAAAAPKLESATLTAAKKFHATARGEVVAIEEGAVVVVMVV